MYNLLELRGEVVSDIDFADVIFDRTYVSSDLEVIRPYNIEKLITFL